MTSEENPWYVYVVRCRDGSLYTGITNDLSKRIDTHNSGKGGRYTASRRPVSLVYREEHRTRSAALKREVEIKRLSHERKMQLR